MFCQKSTAILIAGVLCVTAFVLAQDEATRSVEQQREGSIRELSRPGESAGTVSSRGDSQIAACLLIDNMHEIALSQFALRHAQNVEVRQFAQRMVDEHQHLNRSLQMFAAAGGYDFSRTTTAGTAAGKGAPNPDRPAEKAVDTRRETAEEALQREAATRARATPGPETGLDLVRIRQEIADRCLQSTRRMLEEKPANEFDKQFVDQQVMAHQQMVDALEVLTKYASTELAPVLEDAVKGARAHLQQAKGLAARPANSTQN
jgi:predicted outer membrane protein